MLSLLPRDEFETYIFGSYSREKDVFHFLGGEGKKI